MMSRKFYRISQVQMDKDMEEMSREDVRIPRRGTKMSAGYDFFSPYNFILDSGDEIKLPTGIKVDMEEDEVLLIMPRSSLGFKYYVRLANTTAVIDADYIGSPNEGHIWLKMRNESSLPLTVCAGDAIAQGIFMTYKTVDDEEEVTEERAGGIGSTD
jgi:dUTP pyrophosphatase